MECKDKMVSRMGTIAQFGIWGPHNYCWMTS